VPLLANKGDVSLHMRGELYTGCLISCMPCVNDAWPVKSENEMALEQAEMRMSRYVCGVKDRFTRSELRERE